VQNRSLLSEQPFLPDVLPSLCDTFVSKKIIATPMKIGFLGLGLIGSGAVDSLLRSGHEVTIWNRTASKVVTFFLLIHCVCFHVFILELKFFYVISLVDLTACFQIGSINKKYCIYSNKMQYIHLCNIGLVITCDDE